MYVIMFKKLFIDNLNQPENQQNAEINEFSINFENSKDNNYNNISNIDNNKKYLNIESCRKKMKIIDIKMI